MHPSRSTIVHELAERIRAIEGSGSAAWPPARGWGIEPLDALLPEGRGAAGVLVELLSSAEGAGAWSLAVALAWPVCGEAKVLVVVDERRGFYPPAVARWGIDLERLMVVRPRGRRDRLWAWQQALRCPAVGAVVGDGEPLPPLDARRLQLAAETGGSLGLLLRPQTALAVPSFAWLRLLVAPLPVESRHRRLRVEVVRCRGGRSGPTLLLEIDDATGAVRLLPELAAATVATPPAPAAAAAGRAG